MEENFYLNHPNYTSYPLNFLKIKFLNYSLFFLSTPPPSSHVSFLAPPSFFSPTPLIFHLLSFSGIAPFPLLPSPLQHRLLSPSRRPSSPVSFSLPLLPLSQHPFILRYRPSLSTPWSSFSLHSWHRLSSTPGALLAPFGQIRPNGGPPLGPVWPNEGPSFVLAYQAEQNRLCSTKQTRGPLFGSIWPNEKPVLDRCQGVGRRWGPKRGIGRRPVPRSGGMLRKGKEMGAAPKSRDAREGGGDEKGREGDEGGTGEEGVLGKGEEKGWHRREREERRLGMGCGEKREG